MRVMFDAGEDHGSIVKVSHVDRRYQQVVVRTSFTTHARWMGPADTFASNLSTMAKKAAKKKAAPKKAAKKAAPKKKAAAKKKK